MEATFDSADFTRTTSTPSKTRRRIGAVVSAIPVLFLVFDGVIKLLDVPMVREGCAALGLPHEIVAPLGVVLLVSVALYVVPRTSAFGALLLTGYLGGAIATHARHLDPLLSHTLFPIYLALPIWIGLVLRDERLAAVFFKARTASTSRT